MRHTQAHTCHTALWAVGHPHSWCWYSESGLGGEGVLSLHPLLEFCLAQVLNDLLGRAPQPCSAPASPRPLSQAALSAPGLSHTPPLTPFPPAGPVPPLLSLRVYTMMTVTLLCITLTLLCVTLTVTLLCVTLS